LFRFHKIAQTVSAPAALAMVASMLAMPPVVGAGASHAAGDLDAARLAKADSEPQNWYTGGRDQDGSYYSP
jgi:hypothetical protein